MAHNATLDAVAASVRGILTLTPTITPEAVGCVCEIIQNDHLTGDQIDRIREIIQNHNATLEPPMSVSDACKLLGITKQALHYHCRAGHIRRCSVAGAKRGRGVVAADVRKILNGEAA